MEQTTWYERIIEAHTAVTSSVSHIRRLKSNRYFVWQEDGMRKLSADDIGAEHVMTGSTSLYTNIEFDEWVEDLCASFDAYGIPYRYEFVEYEEDTGLYHHSWDWEIL